jgi:hypothetical protein
MNLLDDDLFEEGVEDTEAPKELAEEDKDLLKSLEKKAAEIEGKGNEGDVGGNKA